MTPRALRRLLPAALLLAHACARPPAPDAPAPAAPVLDGLAVMLLPVQPGPLPRVIEPTAGTPRELTAAERAGLDRELAWWLGERAAGAQWMPADTLRRRLARYPALEVQLERLPTRSFHQARVQRIGDPLFGELYRLGSLTGSPLALLPFAAAVVALPDGRERIELDAALLDVRDGRVLWLGSVAGEADAPGSGGRAAAAAQALARALIR